MRHAILALAVLVAATVPAMAEPMPAFELFLDGSMSAEARQAIQLQINNAPAGDQERAAVDFVADCSKHYGPDSIQAIDAQLFLAQTYWRTGRLKEAQTTLLNLNHYCERQTLKGASVRLCDF
jgi:TolA-binding protein